MVSFTPRSSERERAKAEGRTTYFTGKPCSKGHVAERRVRDYFCTDCQREKNHWDSREYRKDPFKRQILSKREKCKRLGLPFDLTVEDVERITHCPVLGYELDYSVSPETRKDNKATIDRLVPELGYVKGNVHVLSWRANKLKNNGTLEEFKKLIVWMEERLKNETR